MKLSKKIVLSSLIIILSITLGVTLFLTLSHDKDSENQKSASKLELIESLDAELVFNKEADYAASIENTSKLVLRNLEDLEVVSTFDLNNSSSESLRSWVEYEYSRAFINTFVISESKKKLFVYIRIQDSVGSFLVTLDFSESEMKEVSVESLMIEHESYHTAVLSGSNFYLLGNTIGGGAKIVKQNIETNEYSYQFYRSDFTQYEGTGLGTKYFPTQNLVAVGQEDKLEVYDYEKNKMILDHKLKVGSKLSNVDIFDNVVVVRSNEEGSEWVGDSYVEAVDLNNKSLLWEKETESLSLLKINGELILNKSRNGVQVISLRNGNINDEYSFKRFGDIPTYGTHEALALESIGEEFYILDNIGDTEFGDGFAGVDLTLLDKELNSEGTIELGSNYKDLSEGRVFDIDHLGDRALFIQYTYGYCELGFDCTHRGLLLDLETEKVSDELDFTSCASCDAIFINEGRIYLVKDDETEVYEVNFK
jgi:hypothetical protein